MKTRWILLFILAGTTVASAAPQSGDVFREYTWAGPWVNASRWQRVTGPDAKPDRAKAFLPNPVNKIQINDLDQARKVEVSIEMLLCHGGTINKQVRVNDHDWIPIPEPELIPGESGSGPPNTEYQYMRYPCVEIPLKQIKEGRNTFAFTCSCGTDLGGWWPQWIVYGVTFRIYYEDSKTHIEGSITTPLPNAVLGDRPLIACSVENDHDIKQVDIIGLYEDFNWEGDGQYYQWHGRTFCGKLLNHVGSTSKAPWQVTWDNAWIPTQDKPMSLMARITDNTRLCYISPVVGGLTLSRSKTVRMSKPRAVPRRWSTRAGNMHYCKLDIHDDLSKAVDAKIFLSTWNGHGADVIGINGLKLVDRIGRDHDLSYDRIPVPIDYLKPETNTPFTYSDTHHHGIEVNWPGMVLMVQYDFPEAEAKQRSTQKAEH